jgi:hypothetical protein
VSTGTTSVSGECGNGGPSYTRVKLSKKLTELLHGTSEFSLARARIKRI